MAKRGHEPVRTCVACQQEGLKGTLVRVVRTPAGTAAVDPGGHAVGRGAYLHRDASCVETARKRHPPELWAELTPS